MDARIGGAAAPTINATAVTTPRRLRRALS
jgi:hypothetical protein